MTNGFIPETKNVKFWFQYKFRHESVAFIFIKEFVCAVILVVIFQYINFKYLDLFKLSNFDEYATEAERRSQINQNIDTYTSFNFIGNIFAITMLYSAFCKVLFAILSDVANTLKRSLFNRWFVLDLACGLV